MTVDDWVYEAVETSGPRGVSVREIQRWIDEARGEELAVDTIEGALATLVDAGRLTQVAEGRWAVAPRTGTTDAVKRLFGE